MKSLNVFFETALPVFTRFHIGPSVEGMLTICSNGCAMPIYGKTVKNLLQY